MKKKLSVYISLVLLVAAAVCGNVYANDGEGLFDEIYNGTADKDGVKEISYDLFMKLIDSKEKFVLLDVRSEESYNVGHIDSAVSFVINTIDEKSAAKKLTKQSRVIVYCAGFSCHSSASAAKKLASFGYKVLDYKGGMKEWREKGNKTVK